MRIRLLALTAVATLAAAAPASATVVNDPDEPAVAAENDIEWAGVSRRFVSGQGWLYTHTVKTRAPYGSRRPCITIKVAGATTPYRVCSGRVRPGFDPVTVKQEPLGAPDTISYTFNSLAIGNPSVYSWYARAGAPVVDFAPDQGYSKFPPPPRLEEPVPAVQPIFEWQPFMDPGGDW